MRLSVILGYLYCDLYFVCYVLKMEKAMEFVYLNCI